MDGQYVPGPNGEQLVEPVRPRGAPIRYDNLDYQHRSGIVETITDEFPYKKFIGNVYHQRREVGPFPVHSFTSTGSATPVRIAYDSNLTWYPPMQQIISVEPGIKAYEYWQSQNPFDAYTVNSNDVLPGYRSDNRSPELIPKIMNKLDDLHLANSIYEARELPTLWKMFQRRESLYKSFYLLHRYMLGDPRKRFSGGNILKNMAKAYRDGQLNWSFGIMPTIGDVTNIIDEIRNYKQYRKGFVVSVRDQQTIPYAKSNLSFSDGFVATYGPTTLNQSSQRERVFGCRGTFVGKSQPYYSQFFENLENNIRRYIGHNPLGIIWEAIPFSFCVDWLLSVDEVLDSAFLNIQREWKLDYWKSSKISVDRQIRYSVMKDVRQKTPVPIGNWSAINTQYSYETELHLETFSEYSRERMEPPSPIQSLHSRPGTKKVFLLALIALGSAPAAARSR